MGQTVCVIPGDGTGPEVTAAKLKVLDAAVADVDCAEAVVARL